MTEGQRVPSNLRLRSNVLGVSIHDGQGHQLGAVDDADIATRLGYWELLELSRLMPMRFPYHLVREENLTAAQREEKDAFIQVKGRHLWGEWPVWMEPMRPATDSPYFPIGSFIKSFPAIDRAMTQRPVPVDKPTLLQNPAQDLTAPVAESTQVPTARNTLPGSGSLVKAPGGAQIAGLPVEAMVLVMAPPGTGKTHLLINRIMQLMLSGQVHHPSKEILVLSFTRAAVAEIGWRLIEGVNSGAPDDLRYVQVRTFDSLTTLWMMEAQQMVAGDYDQRIKQFRSLLDPGGPPEIAERLAQIRCLMVDEIQDLTGDRADMVLDMVEHVIRVGGGVTLLGDPAQSIYDWSVAKGGTTSQGFLRRLRQLLGSDLQEYGLDRYYRFKNSTMERVVRALGQAMGVDGRTPDGMAVGRVIQELPLVEFESLPELAAGEPLAILTRTNLEAFQLADWCGRHGIPVRFWQDREHWPSWLGRLVFRQKGSTLNWGMVETLWKNRRIGEFSPTSLHEAKAFLIGEGLAHRDRGILMHEVASAVRQRGYRVVGTYASTGVTLATIHSAKGLEFDRVLVLAPKDNYAGEPEEVRVIYVAATRARESLAVLTRNNRILRFQRGTYELGHARRFLGESNFLLAAGLEEIDVSGSFSRPADLSQATWAERVRTFQELLWLQLAGRQGEMRIVPRVNQYAITLSDDSDFPLLLSRQLAADLDELAKRYRGRHNASGGTVPVWGLATVTLPEMGREAEDLIGTAGVVVVPVVRGWITVQLPES